MKYKIVKTKEYEELQLEAGLYDPQHEEIAYVRKERDELLLRMQGYTEAQREWGKILKAQKKDVDKYQEDYKEYKKQIQELFNNATNELHQATDDNRQVKFELNEIRDSFKANYTAKTKDLIEYYKLKNELQQKEYEEMYYKQHELSYAKSTIEGLRANNKTLETRLENRKKGFCM